MLKNEPNLEALRELNRQNAEIVAKNKADRAAKAEESVSEESVVYTVAAAPFRFLGAVGSAALYAVTYPFSSDVASSFEDKEMQEVKSDPVRDAALKDAGKFVLNAQGKEAAKQAMERAIAERQVKESKEATNGEKKSSVKATV